MVGQLASHLLLQLSADVCKHNLLQTRIVSDQEYLFLQVCGFMREFLLF